MATEDAPTLSKRAQQRRRQSLARQLAKALEPMDGIRYNEDLKSRHRQEQQRQTTSPSSKAETNKWVHVKRTRSTLEERIQKRRALRAHARALVQKAREMQKEEAVERSPRSKRVWVPKAKSTPKAKAGDVALRPSSTSDPEPPMNPHRSGDFTKLRIPLEDRVGTLPENRGKALDKESWRSLNELQANTRTGGRTRPPNERIPATASLAVRAKDQEPVKVSPSQRCDSKRATLAGANKAMFTQKKTRRTDERVIPENPCERPIGYSDCKVSELYYQAGGANESRKRNTREADSHCPCTKFIRAVLSTCSCPKTAPQRVSMFERISGGTTKPKSRCSHQRGSVARDDEPPEVTINMVNKGKSPIISSGSDPNSSPRSRVNSGVAQLQLGAVGDNDDRGIHEEVHSDDELSDSHSALASDDTTSSIGQAREVFMVNTEQVAKIIEEALARQKEIFKFEMEMAMQEWRQMHDQQIRALSSQLVESNRRTQNAAVDSDPEVDEVVMADAPPKNTGGGPTKNNNAGGGPTSDDNTGGGRIIPLDNCPKQDIDQAEKMKDLERKIDALMSAREVKKTGIPCPYPKEWDSIPYPAKFNLINFTPFGGKGSPTQHLIYFKSHLGVISGNEPLMVRSFVGTLRGPAFDWYRRLKPGSINSWEDLESMFLAHFFDDDTEVSVRTLFDMKQRDGESVDTFIKRFRNQAMNCKDPVTEEFILQTCQNNLSINILDVMGVEPLNTWKELKVRGEQAERFLRRRKAERSQPMVSPLNSSLVPHVEGDAPATVVDDNQTPQQQLRRQQDTSDQEAQEEYSFKDEDIPAIFESLLENNKIKLPPIMNQEEADNSADPKYCEYHRRILHPTKDCFALKNSIQTLVEAGVITLG